MVLLYGDQIRRMLVSWISHALVTSVLYYDGKMRRNVKAGGISLILQCRRAWWVCGESRTPTKQQIRQALLYRYMVYHFKCIFYVLVIVYIFHEPYILYSLCIKNGQIKVYIYHCMHTFDINLLKLYSPILLQFTVLMGHIYLVVLFGSHRSCGTDFGGGCVGYGSNIW